MDIFGIKTVNLQISSYIISDNTSLSMTFNVGEGMHLSITE